MAKKSAKTRFKKLAKGIRFKNVTKKAKLKTKHTKEQASEKIKSISDQVVGTKEHDIEEPTSPRITNDTVAEHREQVLSEARRFIYPLHSRRRIVITSLSIILALIALTILLTGLMLYRFQSTSGFAYNISKLVPFPVARVDGDFVAYERYLFEVRNSLHYLTNFAQEGVEIDSVEGDELVNETKRRILDKIQIDALGLKLAKQEGISVSNEEIDDQIDVFALRGGIDQSEGTLESILAKYYDWDIKDLRRVVKEQLIFQKLTAALDTEAKEKIDTVVSELESGSKFGSVAIKYSEDDQTSPAQGKIGEVSKDNNTFLKVSLEAIFDLKKGEYSEPIITPGGYYIYRVDNVLSEDTVDVSQIFIRFFSLEDFLNEKFEKVAHRTYITID